MTAAAPQMLFLLSSASFGAENRGRFRREAFRQSGATD